MKQGMLHFIGVPSLCQILMSAKPILVIPLQLVSILLELSLAHARITLKVMDLTVLCYVRMASNSPKKMTPHVVSISTT